jgi:cell wall-associated NlpC family hydrolase
MAVFAYSPAVEIYIKRTAEGPNGTVYDVSPDIVKGQCILRENAPHQMTVTLMNKARRYDALFAPNDLFAIYLKRTRRLLVMSGYLDSVPWYSTWERSVQIFGTCTMKRLLQKRWDPGTTAVLTLLAKEGNSVQQKATDGGMAAKAKGLITQVGGWPQDTVHIGALPTTWADKIATLYTAAAPLLLGNVLSNLGSTVSLSELNSPMVGSTYVPQSLPKGLTSKDVNYFALPGPNKVVRAVPFSSSGNPICPPKYGPKGYYCQMDWGYLAPGGSKLRGPMRAWLARQKPSGSGPVMVYCNTTQKTVLCQPVDDGPGRYNASDYKIGLSKAALDKLSITQDMINKKVAVNVAWCDQTVNNDYYPLGPWPMYEEFKSVKGSKRKVAVGVKAPVWTDNSDNQSPYTVSVESSQQGQSAAQWALKYVGKANYGTTPQGAGGTGQVLPGKFGLLPTFDCSGLSYAAWKQAGVNWPHLSSEGQWWANGNDSSGGVNPKMQVVTSQDQLIPGDLIFYNNHLSGDTQLDPNHVAIYTGTDAKTGEKMTVQAAGHQVGIITAPVNAPPMTITGMGRPAGYPGYNKQKSRTIPGSTTKANQATSLIGGLTQGVPNNTNFINYWEWFGQGPTQEGSLLTGIRGLLNDQPLLPFINTVLNASMRSWCSAPNGDFIAWFPDYFGAYGASATISIADIELMDFSISWSDQNMVTHQYVAASWVTNIMGTSPAGTPTIGNLATTDGIVTLEMGSVSNNILQTVLNLKSGDASGLGDPQAILNRFGARSNFQQIGIQLGDQAQFWYALYLFQLNWASMFTADVPITFMPECFPGMLMRLTDGFQAYINQVVHAWDFTDGGPGFTTQLAIMAPSDFKKNTLFGLPKGGTQAVV